MKNGFLFLCTLVGIAQMQAVSQTLQVPTPNTPAPVPSVGVPLKPSIKMVPPTRLTSPETFVLEPVEDTVDLFHLTASKAATEQVLVMLVAQAGGKAIFSNEPVIPASAATEKRQRAFLRPRPTSITISVVGPLNHLIPLCAAISGLRVQLANNEWTFSPIPHLVVDESREKPPRPDSEMNINRNPGKNLPKGARPFEFNGNRLYHVPIR